jgi:hypothetical protein
MKKPGSQRQHQKTLHHSERHAATKGPPNTDYHTSPGRFNLGEVRVITPIIIGIIANNTGNGVRAAANA